MQFLNRFSLMKPAFVRDSAWLSHGPFAFWLVSELKPASIVELGTHNGYSFFTFCQAVRETGQQTRCFAVDTWQGDEHAGFYGEDVYRSVRQYRDREYPETATLLRKTFAEALSDIEDGSVELLHVDGRHRYEDVKEDFESWMPKLARNAVVLFHDTEVRDSDFGVWKYWAELEDRYPTFNFLHGHGLGVLGVGDNLPSAIRDLFDAAGKAEQCELIRGTYSALGQYVHDRYYESVLHTQIAAERAEVEAERSERAAETRRLQAELADIRSHPFRNIRKWLSCQLRRFLGSTSKR